MCMLVLIEIDIVDFVQGVFKFSMAPVAMIVFLRI